MADAVITKATTLEPDDEVTTVHIMLASRSVTVSNHGDDPVHVTVNSVARGATGSDRTPPTPKPGDDDTVEVSAGESVQVFTSDDSRWVTINVAGAGPFTVDPRNSNVVGVQSLFGGAAAIVESAPRPNKPTRKSRAKKKAAPKPAS